MNKVISISVFLKDIGAKRRVDIIKELLGLMRNFKGVYFEPTVFSTDEIQNDNPFVKVIIRTGVELDFKSCVQMFEGKIKGESVN